MAANKRTSRNASNAASLLAPSLCLITILLSLLVSGCQAIRLPRIDPTGNSLFLPAPNSTTLVSPFQNQVIPNQQPQPYRSPLGGNAAGGFRGNQLFPNSQQFGQGNPFPVAPNPGFAGQNLIPPINVPQVPGPFSAAPLNPALAPAPQTGPAFTQPAAVPNCANGTCGTHLQPSGSLISHKRRNTRKRGTLATTPSRIVAPVGSEVVVMAGVCGGDGHYVMNQPLEWMLSNDSAGQIVEVGGMDHSVFNRLVPPSSKKFDGSYAWGRTGLKPRVIDRGTETCVDDIKVEKGQAWLTLSSASQGTSYLTCVAPKNEGWPERKSITRIHWVDGIWSIPMPSSATAGTVHPLVTQVNRSSDGTGVADWKVKYQVVGGVPAEFGPNGTQTAEVATNAQGQAPVQIRQPAGKAIAGQTQVRVEVVRPGFQGEREVVLESGITTVNWSTPALTIRAIGPKSAGINQPFNYRIEVTNPGDQVARGVTVSTTDIGNDLEYISSLPKPAEYGNRYEWQLGDVQPGAQPKVIDIQMRSPTQGNRQLCFEVASESDQLKTEACAETQIAVPCIGLNIDGPTQAQVGQPVQFMFDVKNECDRPLENVTVVITYDTALETEGDVPNPAELPIIQRILPGGIENLPPLTFRPRQPGTHCFTMEIRSSAGDVSRARRCIEVANVTEPKVRIDMEGPASVRVGDLVLVKMRVTNVGNIPLDDVSLENSFARSLRAIQTTQGIQQTWNGDDMVFALGRLEPNQSRLVEAQFRATRADGDAFSRAVVTTPLGASDQASVPLRVAPVQGGAGAGGFGGEPRISIPADPNGGAGAGQGAGVAGQGLRVNVNARERNVAINNNATFDIAITNDGAVSDQNVEITLLLPPRTRLQTPDLRQTGLEIAENTGRIVRFVPRRELLPGAARALNFPITLQVLEQGEIRLGVNVNSARTATAIEASDVVQVIP